MKQKQKTKKTKKQKQKQNKTKTKKKSEYEKVCQRETQLEQENQWLKSENEKLKRSIEKQQGVMGRDEVKGSNLVYHNKAPTPSTPNAPTRLSLRTPPQTQGQPNSKIFDPSRFTHHREDPFSRLILEEAFIYSFIYLKNMKNKKQNKK